MSRIQECTPCQMGEHQRHYRVVQAVPEGMMGGAICTCEGECLERGPRYDPQIEAILEMFASARAGEEGGA